MWLFWRKNIERVEKSCIFRENCIFGIIKNHGIKFTVWSYKARRKVIRLTAGEPDIRTPDSIIEAAYLLRVVKLSTQIMRDIRT